MRVKPKNHYMFVCFVSIRYLTIFFFKIFEKSQLSIIRKSLYFELLFLPLKFELESDCTV